MKNKILNVKEREERWKEIEKLNLDGLFMDYLFSTHKDNDILITSYIPDITDYSLPIGFTINSIIIKDRFDFGYADDNEKKELKYFVRIGKDKTWIDVFKTADDILLNQTNRVKKDGDWIPMLYNMWIIPNEKYDDNVLVLDLEIHHIT